MKRLIEKYNVPGPRYTSYPTVPKWKHDPLQEDQWLNTIDSNKSQFQSNAVSVYVHLPFCESLCTFCGCHKRITKNHSVEVPYVETLIKEWEMYLPHLKKDVSIEELHLGGGTPTFFSPDHLAFLLRNLLGKNDPKGKTEFSFEAHPKNTTTKHLEVLYDFGFRRLSLGVQDYSPIVQKAINRIQPFKMVKKVHEEAKSMGYISISHDLVFGLPKQTLEDISNSVDLTLQLKPERISLYSYAHVPWIKGNGQRGFDEEDIPKGNEKRAIYESAKEKLIHSGYIEVGMDHFALPEDELAIAFKSKKLHRNFMGYTTQETPLLIGLGASAISDSWFSFAQNEKSVERYQEQINTGHLSIRKGHLLTTLDLEIRKYILDLMCHFETKLDSNSPFQEVHSNIKNELQEMVHEGLVSIKNNIIRITPKGVPFVRNCCMIFDQYHDTSVVHKSMYSSTI